MEVAIKPFGNSWGIILKKSVMKRFSLKPNDILILDEDSPDIRFIKKEQDMNSLHFFDALPISPDAYGSNTEKYLERLEEPEDE